MDNLSPLHGIHVVDMTEALAGPYCGMLLGDLGADVIKVERPEGGDQSRAWGPPFVEGESAYFLSTNRNKRSIQLDIKDADDLNVLHKLLEKADVFVTNNPRMSSLERASLDPDTLRALNSGLIYAAISGYGHTGPKANRSGYDIIAQGEGGLMALTGVARRVTSTISGSSPRSTRAITAITDLSEDNFSMFLLSTPKRPG